ncbi:MAG: 4Fe-4S dicluster domain-containing protein [Thermodesulfobacteriota bacterium]
MAEDVYVKLRQQLDQYSVGFPATASGVEMKILQKLFTPAAAEMYLDLTLLLESPADVARRTDRDPEATAALLDQMAEHGLIFRLRRGGAAKYAASPFVVGFFEFQVKDMDRELARLVDEYMEEAFHKSIAGTVTFMRPIPVNRSLDVSHPVATYEDARAIMKNQKLIAVTECVCRKQQGLLDKGCGKPIEVCFCFGSHAEYYLSRGMARKVSLEEALVILDRSEEAGLVTQPYNTVNPGGLCNCCGDCCGVLRALNKLPRPVEAVVSNYFAEVEAQLCVGCETCLERCQMKAISMSEEGTAEIDLDRCLGCGLCVTTCAAGAMRLRPKPADRRQSPPATGAEQMAELARRRGRSLSPLFPRSKTGSSA